MIADNPGATGFGSWNPERRSGFRSITRTVPHAFHSIFTPATRGACVIALQCQLQFYTVKSN
eukprot:2195483-Prymnesium_polylepis.1